jgi:probable HAF family extracellular repeat protein
LRTTSCSRRLTTAAIAVLVVVVASSCLAPEPATTFRQGAYANDINESGVVVGRAWPPGAPFVDVAYTYDTATGVFTFIGTDVSNAHAVNDDGLVVGQEGAHAFLYDPDTGVIEDIGTLGGFTSAAYDINDEGTIVGFAMLPTGATHAFAYDIATETMDDLGTLGGTHSAATAVNDAGLIVGWSDTVGNSARHAFVYDPATDTMDDLGTLGGINSGAEDLNEAGVIVGWSEIAASDPCEGIGESCPPTRGFSYDLSTGTMTNLRTRPGTSHSYATGINESGVVVGYTESLPTCSFCTGPTGAIGWEVGTTRVYDLGGPDGLSQGNAVNDLGIMAGERWQGVMPSIPNAGIRDLGYVEG